MSGLVQVASACKRRRLGMVVLGFIRRGWFVLSEESLDCFMYAMGRPGYGGHGYGVGLKEWMVLGRSSMVVRCGVALRIVERLCSLIRRHNLSCRINNFLTRCSVRLQTVSYW